MNSHYGMPASEGRYLCCIENDTASACLLMTIEATARTARNVPDKHRQNTFPLQTKVRQLIKRRHSSHVQGCAVRRLYES